MVHERNDSAVEEIPQGIFHGYVNRKQSGNKKYLIEGRENHGPGYHTHLRVLKNGEYLRTGHKIVADEDAFYAIEHGGDVLVVIESKLSKILGEIDEDLLRVFKNIPLNELEPMPAKAKMIMKRKGAQNE